uniref:Putative carboxypeptidase inhibitor n=1 Tax=Rhipicephalus microplus TaxID=6941 RepID=A0A6G5A885_RHIMP
MVPFRVLFVLCLVSGIIASRDCKSSGNECRFVLFCSRSRRVPISGCGFLKTCCKKKIDSCSAMNGKCTRVFKRCAGHVNTTLPCPRGRSCCIAGSH